MADTNKQIASIFNQMADVLQILDANRFRIIAMQKAARVVKELTTDTASMTHAELLSLDGVGKGTADKIVEFCETGQMIEHNELLKEIPKGLPDLLNIPGLGAKTVALLWKEADIVSIKSLERALKKPELLTSIKGLGQKKIDMIAKNLAFAEQAGKRHTIGRAHLKAVYFVAQLRQLKEVKQAAYAGSLRRGKETIGDIDILVAADPKHASIVTERFTALEPVEDVMLSGKTKTSVRTKGGIQVDLRIIAPESYGAALMYFTGSKEHNVVLRERAQSMGMTLSEYALTDKQTEKTVAARTEEEIYKALGLDFIPPELREDRGEIIAAEEHKLPKLVTQRDIHAELHAHTHASDGLLSIRELAGLAYDRGFHTIAVTDHSKSQVQAHGLDEKRLEQHIKDIHAVRDEMAGKIHVLAGSEVDILADGKLDYPNSLLKQLDIVVASPHSALSQTGKKATDRLIKAINNPYVHIIGHPTGRLLARREGMSPDMNTIIKAAADRGIALEINANHHRLDLRDTHARAAIEAGCLLAINTDAHRPNDFNELQYGLLTARRAWAEPKNIVNCFAEDKLMGWLKSCRP
ncbi:DNA polymerase/3'-5' exonuclease PolX [Poriferisphaera corsica]|uniref:DNA polymerase beta n=1 Tax=Poriferisphaera corsica TaxID=2528020 RepID=A0A517YYV8_9BACT|nr:DNA polymerase/3'-5' exonuclease PolX [Poriferisphaera corsica]QDU35413.1 DNA polymerase/3'-5' exonuclease PolX [Poriferisphaera corsica]